MRHNRPIDLADIQAEIASLQQELERVQGSVAENDAALAQLEAQRHETEGRLALARRAQEDVERLLAEKSAALERAEAEASLAAYEAALRAREQAAEELASAAETAAARIREYEAAHEHAADAWDAVSAQQDALPDVSDEPIPEPDREPPRVNEARELLVGLVRKWHDRDLERDLVEAAARSPMGHQIDKLPEHLRGLARERRLAIVRKSRPRHGR